MVKPKDVLLYRNMVAKLAIQAWWNLPKELKHTIAVEDLIQDGLLFARFELAAKWKPDKGKFTTFLYDSLWRRYANHLAVNGNLRLAHRIAVRSLYIDGWGRNDIYDDEAFEAMHLHVVKAFEAIYYDASIPLRETIRRWLQVDGFTKIHTHGERFNRDRQEFLKLANRHGINRSDCEIMMSSRKCIERFTLKLPEDQLIPFEVGV